MTSLPPDTQDRDGRIAADDFQVDFAHRYQCLPFGDAPEDPLGVGRAPLADREQPEATSQTAPSSDPPGPTGTARSGSPRGRRSPRPVQPTTRSRPIVPGAVVRQRRSMLVGPAPALDRSFSYGGCNPPITKALHWRVAPTLHLSVLMAHATSRSRRGSAIARCRASPRDVRGAGPRWPASGSRCWDSGRRRWHARRWRTRPPSSRA